MPSVPLSAARPWQLLSAAPLWLAFLPSAPYLVTDFMPIRARPEGQWLCWYDIVMMAVFDRTGSILGAGSLGLGQRIVGDTLGRVPSWPFALISYLPLATRSGTHVTGKSAWIALRHWSPNLSDTTRFPRRQGAQSDCECYRRGAQSDRERGRISAILVQV